MSKTKPAEDALPTTQTAILRKILGTLQPPYDKAKVMVLFNAARDSLPRHIRDGVNKLTKHRLSVYLSPSYIYKHVLKYEGGPAPMPKTGSVPLPVTIPQTNGRPIVAEAPPPDTYSQKDLEAARRFLATCGDSLLRADKLLKLVSSLITVEE